MTVTTRRFNQSRRNLLQSMAALSGGAFMFDRVLAPMSAAAQPGVDPRVAQLLARTISVDMHSHAAAPYKRPAQVAAMDVPAPAGAGAPPAAAGAAPAGRAGRGRAPRPTPSGPTSAADIAKGLKISGFTTV